MVAEAVALAIANCKLALVAEAVATQVVALATAEFDSGNTIQARAVVEFDSGNMVQESALVDDGLAIRMAVAAAQMAAVDRLQQEADSKLVAAGLADLLVAHTVCKFVLLRNWSTHS